MSIINRLKSRKKTAKYFNSSNNCRNLGGGEEAKQDKVRFYFNSLKCFKD